MYIQYSDTEKPETMKPRNQKLAHLLATKVSCSTTSQIPVAFQFEICLLYTGHPKEPCPLLRFSQCQRLQFPPRGEVSNMKCSVGTQVCEARQSLHVALWVPHSACMLLGIYIWKHMEICMQDIR